MPFQRNLSLQRPHNPTIREVSAAQSDAAVRRRRRPCPVSVCPSVDPAQAPRGTCGYFGAAVYDRYSIVCPSVVRCRKVSSQAQKVQSLKATVTDPANCDALWLYGKAAGARHLPFVQQCVLAKVWNCVLPKVCTFCTVSHKHHS